MTTPNTSKLAAAITQILASPEATQTMIDELRKQGDLHVFRGMAHMIISNPEREANARKAIVLDTETTGLDHLKDKVFQLSMLEILYDDDGIVKITDNFFDQLQDPGTPLDPKISRLTGFTDADLKGQTIDLAAAAAFLDGADLIIAHNASFDRKMVEANFPTLGFQKMDWACSIKDVDWDVRTSSSPKLELLVHAEGYVYPAHNAKADCTATAFMLSRTYDGDTPVMSDIIVSRGRKKVMIMATDLGYGRQEPLKAAGWKWSPDRNGDAGDKCWHIIVGTPEEAQKAAAAAREAYGGDVRLPVREITARSAYSTRLPEKKLNAFEVKNPLKALGVEDIVRKEDEQPGWKF